MTLWATASKVDRQAIRKDMLREADEMLKPLYFDSGQRHAAARVMVDRALAKENHESSSPQLPA